MMDCHRQSHVGAPAGAPNATRSPAEGDLANLEPAVSAGDTFDGAEGNRTPDPLLAKQVLSQLRYRPEVRNRQRVTPGNRTSNLPGWV